MSQLSSTKIFILFFIILINSSPLFSQVSITNDGSEADSSAMLEVTSTNRGFLPPRVTDTLQINSPVEGLIIYDLGKHCLRFYNGTKWSDCLWAEDDFPDGQYCNITTEVVEVISPTTGRVWMDRNLGATQVADSLDDENAYGFLYQWGRESDGHQCRNSGVSSSTSDRDTPGHPDFILGGGANNDWRDPKNDNLWDLPASGFHNNPCPEGYRIPTYDELNAERADASFTPDNNEGAFNSFLKLPSGGERTYTTGDVVNVGTQAHYWTQDLSTDRSICHLWFSGGHFQNHNERAFAKSIRCIRD